MGAGPMYAANFLMWPRSEKAPRQSQRISRSGPGVYQGAVSDRKTNPPRSIAPHPDPPVSSGAIQTDFGSVQTVAGCHQTPDTAQRAIGYGHQLCAQKLGKADRLCLRRSAKTG